MSRLPDYAGISVSEVIGMLIGSAVLALGLVVAAGLLLGKLRGPLRFILPIILGAGASTAIVLGFIQPSIHQRIAELDYAIAIQDFATEKHGVELSDEDTLEIVKANGPDFDREKLQELIDQKLQEYSSKG